MVTSEKLKNDEYLLGLISQGKYAKISDSIKKIVDKKLKERVSKTKAEYIKKSAIR